MRDSSKQWQVFPVEAWLQNKAITFGLPVTQNVVQVQVDPDGALPDVDRGNNVWKVR